MRSKNRKSGGFALVAVLITLSIITLLASIASRTALQHSVVTSTTRIGIQSTSDLKSVLAALDIPNFISGETVLLNIDAREVEYRVIDVRGMADVNTADPELLGLVMRAAGMEGETIEAALKLHASWRSEGLLFNSVRSFLAEAAARPQARRQLALWLTAHSGRRDIVAGLAPPELRDFLQAWPSNSEDSGHSGTNSRNFAIQIQNSNSENFVPRAIVHSSGNGVGLKVLAEN